MIVRNYRVKIEERQEPREVSPELNAAFAWKAFDVLEGITTKLRGSSGSLGKQSGQKTKPGLTPDKESINTLCL